MPTTQAKDAVNAKATLADSAHLPFEWAARIQVDGLGKMTPENVTIVVNWIRSCAAKIEAHPTDYKAKGTTNFRLEKGVLK